MKTRIVLGLVIALVASMATNADATKTTWVHGLPIIKGMKSEVGIWNFLWGSTLILVAPRKFPGYWPDYGYRWSNSTYLELCGRLEHDLPAKDPYLGRVRMVAQNPENDERLIGVELQLEERIKETLATDKPRTSEDKPGLTLNQLCELLDDDIARTRAETVVRVMATDPTDILASGTWGSANTAIARSATAAMDYDYMLSWKGLGIDDPMAVGHDLKWTFEEGSEVVWRHPKHVQLRAQERLDMAGSDTETKIVAAMGFDQVAQAPNYMLTRMAGTWEPRKQPKDMTFEVIDGAVDSNFLSAANLKEADLTNATFGVWTNIAKYAELMRENNTSVWLVTENAIREGSLSPEIRVSND